MAFNLMTILNFFNFISFAHYLIYYDIIIIVQIDKISYLASFKFTIGLTIERVAVKRAIFNYLIILKY